LYLAKLSVTRPRRLCVARTLMLAQVILASEHLPTHFALVRRFAGVLPHMASQVRPVGVLHVAKGAMEWLLARMGPKVDLQGDGPVKLGWTGRALDVLAFAPQLVVVDVTIVGRFGP
jgi:hypothetical protein